MMAVVHLLSCIQLFAAPWATACQVSLSFVIFQSLLRLLCTESVMPSKPLILCHPLLLPSVFPSVRIFSSESALHIRWSKKVSASASVLPVNIQNWFPLGLTGLISLLSKGLSKSLLQYHNSSVLSLLYGPTLISIHDYWKNHSFDSIDPCWQSDVFAFCTLSMLVIAFFP